MASYCSTRGYRENVTFEETLFTSYLPDQSLLMPQNIDQLDRNIWKKWSLLTYKEISAEIFKLFDGESLISSEQYKTILDDVYHYFPTNVVPYKQISNNAFVLELFHGPTKSFKDLAMVIAGKALNIALKMKEKHAVVLVCTTGDTGSSVIEATKDVSHIDSLVLFPDGNRITMMQRLLMTTQQAANIHNVTANTSCDAFDILLYQLSREVPKRHPNLVVTSLNSLLWMRIMQQMVHVIYSYFRIVEYPKPLNIVVPTGGGGHLTACLLVKKLGLPISIHTAFNSKNQNFYQFLNGSTMYLNKEVSKSLSPAMDIQLPCNLERIIYLLLNKDTETVKELMLKLFGNGEMKPPQYLLEQIKSHITPLLTSDAEIRETIERCWNEYQYIIDPHTAVGFNHYFKRKTLASNPTVFFGCASPIKFMDVLQEAKIPIPNYYNEYFEKLKGKEEKFVTLPNGENKWLEYLLRYIKENIAIDKS